MSDVGRPKSIRFDDELLATIQSEADRLGINDSEYIRQAVVLRIAWSMALRAVQEYGPPSNDPADFFTRTLTDIAEKARRLNGD